jgi:hypothetical protein
VSQLVADLQSSLSVKMSIKLTAFAAVDGCEMAGDLFVAFASIGCAQLVETFEVVRMKDLSGGAYDT